jgi:hypothetical protein
LHIDELKLELFAANPNSFNTEEKKIILTHIDSCARCMEIFQLNKKIFQDIDSNLNSEPDENDYEFARKIIEESRKPKNKLLPESKDSIVLSSGEIQVISRPKFFSVEFIKYSIKNNPLQTIGFSFSIIIGILLFINITKPLVKDTNPVFAEIKNRVLTVYNIDRDVLWKKTVSLIPNTTTDTIVTGEASYHLKIFDVNGDNRNEVLLWGYFKHPQPYSCDSIYCFKEDGNLLWKNYAGAPFLEFRTHKWKHTKWNIIDVLFRKIKNKRYLFACIRDNVYAPSAIVKLDALNGNYISSFYNCGYISSIAEFDINNDNNKEFIVASVNNGIRAATIIVISPDRIEGIVPSIETFYPKDINKGSELYLIKLPWSDFAKKKSTANFNSIDEINLGKNMFTVFTSELRVEKKEIDWPILYTFDKQMKVQNVIGSVNFVTAYEKAYSQGEVSVPADTNYFNALRDSVKYWDGDKFVSKPTMNKYFNKKFPLPQSKYSVE